MVADIESGNLDLADILFLIGVILFVVAAFVAYGAKALWATVVCAGLAAVALGLLVL